jgi:hypothetical protein
MSGRTLRFEEIRPCTYAVEVALLSQGVGRFRGPRLWPSWAGTWCASERSSGSAGRLCRRPARAVAEGTASGSSPLLTRWMPELSRYRPSSKPRRSSFGNRGSKRKLPRSFFRSGPFGASAPEPGLALVSRLSKVSPCFPGLPHPRGHGDGHAGEWRDCRGDSSGFPGFGARGHPGSPSLCPEAVSDRTTRARLALLCRNVRHTVRGRRLWKSSSRTTASISGRRASAW